MWGPEDAPDQRAQQWREAGQGEAQRVRLGLIHIRAEALVQRRGGGPGQRAEQAAQFALIALCQFLTQRVVAGKEPQRARPNKHQAHDERGPTRQHDHEAATGRNQGADHEHAPAGAVQAPAPIFEPPRRRAGDDATHVGRDVIADQKPLGELPIVAMLMLEQAGQPGAKHLPGDVDRHDHGKQHEEPLREHMIDKARPRRVVQLGPLGRREGLQIVLANREEPEDDPDDADRADSLEHGPPTAGRVGGEGEHDQRRGDGPDRRATLQDAVAQAAILPREQLLRGLERAGPVSRLEQPEQRAANEQRFERIDQSRRKAHRRPHDEHEWIEPTDRDPIGDEAEQERPGREGVAEPGFELAVVLFAEAELDLDLLRGRVEGHAVHVVEHRGQQQQAADVPGPIPAARRCWCRVVH